jgi:sigma-B regulation protein RsbU (phosphoserine phosphatase)
VLLESLRNEYRRHRVARFAIWVVAYGFVLWLTGRTTGSVPAGLWFLFWAIFIPTAIYYLYRLFKLFKQKLLWRLSRRLAVTYVFIAFVPILLLVLLVGFGAFMINGQFASYLISIRLAEREAELQELDRILVHEARMTPVKTPDELLARLQGFFVAEMSEQAASFPGLEITAQVGTVSRSFRLDGSALPSSVTIPPWLDGDDFSGTVQENGRILIRALERRKTSVGELTIVLSQPFTPELLDILGAGIGPVGILTPPGSVSARDAGGNLASGGRVSVADEGAQGVAVSSKSVQVPPQLFFLDFNVLGTLSLDPLIWDSAQKHFQHEGARFVVTSRIIALNRYLFNQLGDFSSLLALAFMLIAGVFFVIEIFAVIVGYQLTRSMTNTVDKLYVATERVKAGDFSHRVGLQPQDQLSALGEAFDGMASSVQRLVRESLEKTRLEGELEIAREVQSQLFPQSVPEVPGLQLFGVCKPARTVSGDYYDFLRLGEDRTGLVVGDISGKGISAALLMASIQSALHAQFYDGHAPGIISEEALKSSAGVVGRLNRQLYASTPTEKYATFFYAIYDAATRKLTFTNAGHPPPFYFHRGKIERLETGGTVVGLFGPATYEQAVIQLEPGDMLVAFTDGMTEPENSFGEEFGEDRLLEAVVRAAACAPEELVKEIYRTVNDWTGSPELQDDMTVVVARAIE